MVARIYVVLRGLMYSNIFPIKSKVVKPNLTETELTTTYCDCDIIVDYNEEKDLFENEPKNQYRLETFKNSSP